MDFKRAFHIIIAVWCCIDRYITAQRDWSYLISISPTDSSFTDSTSSSYNSVQYYDHMYYTQHYNHVPTSSQISHTVWPNYDWYTSPSESSSTIQSSNSVTPFILSSTNGSALHERNYFTNGSLQFNGTTDTVSFQNNEFTLNVTSPYPTSYYTSPSNNTSFNASTFYEPSLETSELVTLPTTSNETFTYSSNNIVNTTEPNNLNTSSISDIGIVPSISSNIPVLLISSMPALLTSYSSVTIIQEVNSSPKMTDRIFQTETSLTPTSESEINVTSVLKDVTKTSTGDLSITSNPSNLNVSEIPYTQDRDQSSYYLSPTHLTINETARTVSEYEQNNDTESVLSSTSSRDIMVNFTRTIENSRVGGEESTATLETSFSLPSVSLLTDTPGMVQTSFSLVASKDVISTTNAESVKSTSTIEVGSPSPQMIDSVLTETTLLYTAILTSTTAFQGTADYTSITPSSSFDIDVSSQIISVPEKSQDYRILITFEGTCGKLKDNELLKIEFIEALVDVIQNLIPNINVSNVELEQFICDPFTVVLLLKGVKYESHIVKLQSMVKNITVPIIDTTIIKYQANGVKLLPETNTIGDDGHLMPGGLETSDIVVIVISALLFAFILLLCGIAICRECYKRKRAASFNLLEVPHVNVKMDDFTLTRIPRPKMSYFESNPNPIVTNGRHRLGTDNSELNGNVDNKVKVNSENIHVRMRDHSGGLVIGVTCLPIKTDAASPSSDTSSPTTPCMDQSEHSLIKVDRPEHGTTNPNCSVEDEVLIKSKTIIREDGKEEFL